MPTRFTRPGHSRPSIPMTRPRVVPFTLLRSCAHYGSTAYITAGSKSRRTSSPVIKLGANS
eukprot:scaffold34662_cov64-Phaeocystis_antarctica.AAC.5